MLCIVIPEYANGAGANGLPRAEPRPVTTSRTWRNTCNEAHPP